MSMSTSAVGSGGAGGFDISKMAASVASRMMNQLDTNKDGKLDKAEFVSGLVAKGVSADAASKQFDAIDTKKTGTITKADIETAVKSGTFKPTRGGPPPGGAGPAGGAASAQTYAAADTNKDGVVSAEEALIYSFSHATNSSSASASSSNLGNNIDATA